MYLPKHFEETRVDVLHALIHDNPLDPRNRRISIVVLRENKLPGGAGASTPDDSASAARSMAHHLSGIPRKPHMGSRRTG